MKQKKVVAEPTLTGNVVYYPIYKPSRSTECGGLVKHIFVLTMQIVEKIFQNLGQNTAAGHTNERLLLCWNRCLI